MAAMARIRALMLTNANEMERNLLVGHSVVGVRLPWPLSAARR